LRILARKRYLAKQAQPTDIAAERRSAQTELTDVTQQHGQEDQAVPCAQKNHAQIHPEVKDSKDLRRAESQDGDPDELCHCNAAEYLGILNENH